MYRNYEYNNETVISLGIDHDGNYVIETKPAATHEVTASSRLTVGIAVMTVEEVCAIWDIKYPGQIVYGLRKWED